MGGPAAGLWLSEPRSALEAVPWLEGFCEIRTGEDDSVEFDVRDPSELGLSGLDLSMLCDFHLGSEPLEDDEEYGYPGLDRRPAAELCLVTYCSGPVNHLVLGHLVRYLAERFDALIDFYGLLGYRSSGRELAGMDEAARLADARAFVAGLRLPGRVWEMPYSTGGGGTWYSHVGDVDFLAAWLGHPEFRMLK